MCHNNKIMLDKNLINKSILQGKILKGSPLTQKQLDRLASKKYKNERANILFNTK